MTKSELQSYKVIIKDQSLYRFFIKNQSLEKKGYSKMHQNMYKDCICVTFSQTEKIACLAKIYKKEFACT